MPTFTYVIDGATMVLEGAGITAIVLGLLVAALRAVRRWHTSVDVYRQFRQDIGRGILLGLEFLVAADIIRTVAVRPTLDGVMVLGLIVVIRTFLSMALQVELEGRWPWQSVKNRPPTTPAR